MGLATVICFDTDVPQLVRQAGKAGIDISLVPASDWQAPGKRIAPWPSPALSRTAPLWYSNSARHFDCELQLPLTATKTTIGGTWHTGWVVHFKYASGPRHQNLRDWRGGNIDWCLPAFTLLLMSDTGATVGDVYEVFRGIVKDVVAFGPKRKRPIVCVAENRHRPAVAYWRGVSRTSSRPIQGNDVLPSPAQHERGLDKAGHWQFRWVHEVLKSKVGTPSCVLLGSLSAEERKAVLKRYKNRLNNSDVIP